MEKEKEKEPLIAAFGQDNNHDELSEGQLGFFENKIIEKRSSSSTTKLKNQNEYFMNSS
ncbi:MAG: hypothetical protein JO297_07320 [Nitrososphaeraceae archaeon]|nr:hypothetical protein [Nitrososphaeraceae archaeon]